MIPWEIWLPFLGYTIPMVISPGPGNTLLAAAGGRFGIRASLPFWTGFEAANLVLCLVYGLGVGRALQDHPGLDQALKWAGAAYLAYVAWRFFRMPAGPAGDDRTEAGTSPAKLRFGDGFLPVVLNPKIHTMILVMFSQFLDPARPLPGQFTQLTVAFLVVCLACHFPWIYAGKIILGRFRSARALRLQGWTFGTCMVLVAAYTVWS